MAPKKDRPIYLLSPSSREGIIHMPMISFSTTVESIDFSVCDTLLFTSKQAVKSVDSIDPSWKEYPCISIGSATKKQIEDLGGSVIYNPKNFYADELVEDIAESFSNKNILYLRPQEVSFDTKGYLTAKGVTLYEQIIYKTSCVEYDKIDTPCKNAIIIFTSPSSIRCFLKNFLWDPSYTAVVIGRATLKYLPANIKYAMAKEPLIDACVSLAKELQSY